MKILMIDNYDSFTYNLVQYLRELTNTKITVVRNDEVPVDFVQDFDCIFISPGPGVPKDSGIIIGEAFGGNLTNLDQVYHGEHTPVMITDPGETIFAGIPSPFQAGRYHSWVVSKDNFPQDLVITAEDEHGMIMAASHRTYQVKGVQFHPESILTPDGKRILKNMT